MTAGRNEVDVQVLFNPQCSKCRTVRALLEERDIEADYVRYLEQAPTREQLEHVLDLLGTDDPRKMMRTKDATYADLGLASAARNELLNAMVEHPILIERPIVIRGDRAVIGRPPERILELISD